MSEGYSISFDNAETIEVDVEAAGLQATIVPVMFRKNGLYVASEGTAFCIAVLDSGEATFVTAKHIIEQSDGATDIEPFILLPRALDSSADRRNLQGVRIQQVSMANTFSDVALLVVDIKASELPVSGQLRGLQITLGPAIVGQYCMALG